MYLDTGLVYAVQIVSGWKEMSVADGCLEWDGPGDSPIEDSSIMFVSQGGTDTLHKQGTTMPVLSLLMPEGWNPGDKGS